jgi:hypothetical protein
LQGSIQGFLIVKRKALDGGAQEAAALLAALEYAAASVACLVRSEEGGVFGP